MKNNGLRLLILKEFLKISSFNQKILREGGGEFIEFFASKIGNKTAKDIWMAVGNKIIGKDIKSALQLSTEEAKVLNDFFGKFPSLSRVVFVSGDTIEKILDATSTAIYQKSFSNLTQGEQDLVYSYVRNPDSLASKLEKRASEIAAQAPAASVVAYDLFRQALRAANISEVTLYEYIKNQVKKSGKKLSQEDAWANTVKFLSDNGITVTQQIEKDAKPIITTNVLQQVDELTSSASYKFIDRTGAVALEEAGLWAEEAMRIPRKITFSKTTWIVLGGLSVATLLAIFVYIAFIAAKSLLLKAEGLAGKYMPSSDSETPSISTTQPQAPRGPRIGGSAGGSPSASSPPASGGGGIETPPK